MGFKGKAILETAISARAILASAVLALTTAAALAQSGIDASLLSRANGGDSAAQVQVGEAYAEGKGVSRDPRMAAEWYTKAADKGNINAELHLAVLYRDGAGKNFPRDVEQAATWYRKAADQGDAGAQATLGMLYTLGQGVPKNDVDAYFWLDLAASMPGRNQAQYASNRQNVGTRITADDLDAIHEREDKWKAEHPRAPSKQ
jgi:TPR repeat protein